MSLPIIILFERHWDCTPKSLLKEMLPDLSLRGYKSFCFEAPQNLTSTDIIHQHRSGVELDSTIEQQAEKLLKQVGITCKLSNVSFSTLAQQLRLYVSSKKYVEVAEKIKQLPASQILKEIFDEAEKLAFDIKGIDLDSDEFFAMLSNDISQRMPAIVRREDQRITTMVQNLLKLRAEQEEGIIFACGALHTKGLIEEFNKRGLKDEVLFYFPHSSMRYDESVDDIEDLINLSSGFLSNHSHLLNPEDIQPFGTRILSEITQKTTYSQEILYQNSHIEHLNHSLQTHFRSFLRPGYHLDALLNVSETPNIEEIQKRIITAAIKTHYIFLEGQKTLVIPNINTQDIANKIRQLRILND